MINGSDGCAPHTVPTGMHSETYLVASCVAQTREQRHEFLADRRHSLVLEDDGIQLCGVPHPCLVAHESLRNRIDLSRTVFC